MLGRDADARIAYDERGAACFAPQRIVIEPLAGVYFTAFDIRLEATECSSPSLPRSTQE